MFKRILFAAICSSFAMFSVASAQWTTSGNNIYNNNTGTVGVGTGSTINTNYKLEVDNAAGSFTSGYRSAIYGDATASGSTASGTALGHVGAVETWAANGFIQGVRGNISSVSALRNNFSNFTSIAAGGGFIADLSNPLGGGGSGTGTYWIGGSVSQLSGTATTKPTSGAVAAVIGVDNINDGGTWAAYFSGRTGSTGGYFQPSDARYKENVSLISNALNKVLTLEGVTYDYKTADFPNMHFDADRQMGFIAQEVEKVVPEVVRTQPDGLKMISYSNLTALLVEAVKEQQVTIDNLQSEVAALNARLAAIENMLNNTVTPSGKGTVTPDLGTGASVGQNDPNPFAGSTRIEFSIPRNAAVAELLVNDAVTGKEMLRINIAERGQGSLNLDARNLNSGVYFYSLLVDGAMSGARKMMVVK